MGGIGPGVFLTRDVIEHVLPAALLALLFAPLVVQSQQGVLQWELVFGSVVVLSYALGSVSQAVADSDWYSSFRKYFLKTCIANISVHKENGSAIVDGGNFPALAEDDDLRAKRKWLSDCWDYTKLFYKLTQDEREYLYLTRAYLNLFKISSLYFLFFACFGLFWWLGHCIVCVVSDRATLLNMLEIGIPSALGEAPVLLLIVGATVAAWALDGYYIMEYRSLFDATGSYPQFARRYHQEGGALARAVWGQYVPASTKALSGLSAKLLVNGIELACEKIDSNGNFQFRNVFDSCVGFLCEIHVQDASGEVVAKKYFLQKRDAIPESVIK